MDGIAAWIAAAAGVLVSLGIIYRKAVRPVVRGIDELGKLMGPDKHGRTISDRLKTVEERTAQLVPNGGNSLYDRVGKLERNDDRLMQLEENFELLQREHRSTNRRITTLTTKLAPMAEAIATLAGPRRSTQKPTTKEHP